MKLGWYCCKTLLACDPDINRRSLYYFDGEHHSDAVFEFNREMGVWTPERESALVVLLTLLNQSEAKPARWK